MCALGDLAAARGYYEKSLAIYKELNHKWGIAEALGGLGWAVLRGGNHAAALSLFEESLRLSQEMGHKRSTGSTLCALGKLALLGGDYSHAARLYREALTLLHGLEDREGVAGCLEGLAALALGRAQLDHAARLYGAARALRELIDAPVPPAERAEYDRSLSDLRSAAGAPRFDHAWAEGKAMTLNQAFEYALSVEDAPLACTDRGIHCAPI